MVRITKALAEQGFEVLVLTVKSSLSRAKDSSLLSEVENRARIYRTESLDPKRIAYLLARFFSRKKSPQITQPSSTSSSAFFKWLWRMFSRLRNWLLIPDEYIGWLPFALVRASRIILKEKPALIITSSSPHSVQLVGLALKKIFKIPWLADFRDAWARHPFLAFPTNAHCKLNQVLEKIVVKNAELISTAYGLKNWQDAYPGLESKFHYLPNGYREQDFAQAEKKNLPGFNLLYLGAFYGPQSPEVFFRSLRFALKKHPEIKKELKVWMVGQFNPEHLSLIQNFELSEWVQVQEYLPHSQALGWMLGAFALVLILAGEKESFVVPGKVFEYLRSPAWILALLPEGESAEILKKAGGVIICSSGKVEETAEAIFQLFQFWKEKKIPERNQKWVEQFEEKNLSKILVELVNSLMK